MRVHQPTLRSYMTPTPTLRVLPVTLMLVLSNGIEMCYRIYNSHKTSKDIELWICIEYDVTGNSIRIWYSMIKVHHQIVPCSVSVCIVRQPSGTRYWNKKREYKRTFVLKPALFCIKTRQTRFSHLNLNNRVVWMVLRWKYWWRGN